MESLIEQTVPPQKIVAVDDGSSDGTYDVLRDYANLYPDLVELLETNSKTRDYKRIPSLWNLGLRSGFDFHMIMAGDCSLPPNYCEELLKEFAADSTLAIISGGSTEGEFMAPLGAGRMVRNSFFYKYYKKYPLVMGYESEILERAILEKWGLKVRNDLKLTHHEKLGHGHNFREFGQGMRCLGYYPPYAFARCIWDFFNNDVIGRRGAINMFWYYITFRPQTDGYFSLFPADIRAAIRERQRRQFMSATVGRAKYLLRVRAYIAYRKCKVLGYKSLVKIGAIKPHASK
jgi:glycosyltransferase involved in cell wall biosynthesis